MTETTFTLDTSGAVIFPAINEMTGEPDTVAIAYRWTDLSPFTQGYVEALFANTQHIAPRGPVSATNTRTGVVRPVMLAEAFGFSDLAPEALALILKDCAAFQVTPEYVAWAETLDGNLHEDGADFASGQAFWFSRNRTMPGFLVGPWPEPFATDLWTAATDGFPPLTPYLGDDGKVHLKAAPLNAPIPSGRN